MEGNRFSPEELIVLRSLFDVSDSNRTGLIHISQLAALLTKLGKNTAEAASRLTDENEGQISFEEFYTLLEEIDSVDATPVEGQDPKVAEFLRILEEYRVKCEDEGNYLEAGRAHKQLGVLRKQEEKRQQRAVKSRQNNEKDEVLLSHNAQFSEFNDAWDGYMAEYDGMAHSYILQMTERHAAVLLDYQKQLRHELLAKPPKWSRELVDMRRKQLNCAKGKAYAEAQKLKKHCDKIEEGERREMESAQAVNFAKKEAKYRLHQQSELHALLKRIECRRKEHIKQRNLDSQRFQQRNRNVMAVLESKQAAETQRIFLDIKKNVINGQSTTLASTYQGGRNGSVATAASNGSGGSGEATADNDANSSIECKADEDAQAQADINNAINRDMMAQFGGRSFFPRGNDSKEGGVGSFCAKVGEEFDYTIVENDDEESDEGEGEQKTRELVEREYEEEEGQGEGGGEGENGDRDEDERGRDLVEREYEEMEEEEGEEDRDGDEYKDDTEVDASDGAMAALGEGDMVDKREPHFDDFFHSAGPSFATAI